MGETSLLCSHSRLCRLQPLQLEASPLPNIPQLCCAACQQYITSMLSSQ